MLPHLWMDMTLSEINSRLEKTVDKKIDILVHIYNVHTPFNSHIELTLEYQGENDSTFYY